MYIPEKIQEIVESLTYSGDITNINEVGSNSELTITNYENLIVGMIIQIDNKNYQITAINNNVITIIATGLTANTWTLAINYLYGHRTEINEILINKEGNTETKFKNFPLIWLDLDIEETKDDSYLIESEAKIILVFVYKTKKEYTADVRLTDNFKLILQPLLDLFMTKINSYEFNQMFVKGYGEKISYKKIDRYFYGSNDKNKSVFKTLTDAIEVEIDLKFRKEFNNCN